MRFLPRKSLPHETPAWVVSGSLFFITINAADRGSCVLTEPSSTAEGLIESAAYYHRNNDGSFA